ncbi:MAG: hypothetical protein U0T82_01220 [Bacteroidales bacterium]
MMQGKRQTLFFRRHRFEKSRNWHIRWYIIPIRIQIYRPAAKTFIHQWCFVEMINVFSSNASSPNHRNQRYWCSCAEGKAERCPVLNGFGIVSLTIHGDKEQDSADVMDQFRKGK